MTAKTKIRLLYEALDKAITALQLAHISAGEPVTAKATEPFRIDAITKGTATLKLLS